MEELKFEGVAFDEHMLIVNFGNVDIQRMYDEVREMVYTGKTTEYVREFARYWYEHSYLVSNQNASDSHYMIVFSTIFPMRLFDSILQLKCPLGMLEV